MNFAVLGMAAERRSGAKSESVNHDVGPAANTLTMVATTHIGARKYTSVKTLAARKPTVRSKAVDSAKERVGSASAAISALLDEAGEREKRPETNLDSMIGLLVPGSYLPVDTL